MTVEVSDPAESSRRQKPDGGDKQPGAGAPPDGSETGRRSAWAIGSWVSAAVALVVRLYVAWSARWPSFPYDEVLQLQMSRMLVGLDVPDVLGGAGYFPAWSALMAPLWWISEDPLVVYRMAIFLGVLVAMTTIWPFALVLGRWGLTRSQAVVAASVVMTLPARALQSDWVLSEQLLFLAVVLLVLAVARLGESPTVLRAVVVAAAAFLVLFTHARMLPVMAALLVWLLLFLRRRWQVAVVGLVLVAAATYGANWLGRELNEMLLGDFVQGERFWDQLVDLRPGLLVRTMFGQAWSQLLSSFGLVALGAVAAGAILLRDLRRFRFGMTTFVVGAALAVYLASALNWASDYHLFFNEWVRLDTWLYTRYIDPLSALVIASGIVLIIRGARRFQHLVAIGLALAVAVPVLIWVAPQAPTFGYVTPAHMPGVMPWAWLLPDEGWAFPYGAWIVPTFTNENRFWLIATISVLVVMVVLALLRRRVLVSVWLLIALAAGSTVVANEASDAFQESNGVVGYEMLDALDAMREADADLEVVFIRDCPMPGLDVFAFRNYVFYWDLPDLITSVPSDTPPASADVAISCTEWPYGLESGAVPLPETARGTEVLWLLSDDAVAAAREAGLVG